MVINWTVAATLHPKNVLYLKPVTYSTINQAGVDALGDVVAAALDATALESYLSTQTRLNSVTVTDLTTSTSPQFTSHDLDEAGESNTDYLPTQTAGMIEWVTALRGPSFRGKTFIPGFTENASDGRPVAGCLSAIQDFADELISRFDAVDYPLAIASFFSGTMQVAGKHPGDVITVPKPRDTATVTLITAGTAEEVWKTQRRRSTPG
jgi:hypothetical protein